MVTKKLRLTSKRDIILILGVQDSNLRNLEHKTGADIFVRHDSHSEAVELTIRGSTSKVDKTILLIQKTLDKYHKEIFPKKISTDKPIQDGVIYHRQNGINVKPRGLTQTKYASSLFDYDMTVSIGPAGTGKTFLAVAAALRCLELNIVERIILTRPIVEAGEKLGFLPGDIYEKVHPYLKPLYDAFQNLLGPDRFRSLRQDGIIEIIPLAYMRGRTLENAYILLDEAQNTLPEQMKMFLTRMGLNSKMAITGDITQIDLVNKKDSGLVELVKIFKNTKEIKIISFTHLDVVRHHLVKKIIQIYEKWEAKKTK
ncbi:MAG TPA: PhoH family protein [Elusimicrobiales bacterium]|nr:PhoH family protein [Elusimicrobiales bacterium]